jgi:acyl carrier protein
MVGHLLERLVLEVVRTNIGDDGAEITLGSDLDDLNVDQLTMTYIVLELEGRIGVELPSDLEDARTVAQLVAGVQIAVRASERAKRRFLRSNELLPMQTGRPSIGRHSIYYGHYSGVKARHPRRIRLPA